jgi:eukaryotic-like serine/threonine-protein kinase
VETKQEWQRLKELFAAALEHDPSQRAAFLQEACGEDASLREEVKSLLEAHDSSSSLWRSPFRSQSPERAEGCSIGPYHLLKKIGEGGMGQVWLAQQTAPLQRQVALKLVRWGMYDETLAHRFEAERQSLAVMDHPAIAKVFDAGATSEGQPYFVMEYVAGVPITDFCDRKKLRIRERLELFVKVCEGVQHAHQKAIIHRDLKPANILVVEVDGKPVPRIIDFGLAKAMGTEIAGHSLHTHVGSFVGTPGYMSPEQCDATAKDIDTRTDVYSLGVVLYVLLSGSLPFDTKEWKDKPLDEMLRRLREEDPVRPSTKISTDREASSATAQARGTDPKQLISLLHGDLDWITMKAVEKNRVRRYGTPSDLAADINHYLNNEPITARPASVSYRVQKYVRRHRYSVAAAGVFIALLIAFAVTQNIQLRKTRRERDRADRIAEFMKGIFKVSDPKERVGSTVSAQEILDKSAEQISTGLAKDPELQSQLMHVMGEAYLNLGLQQRAQSLLEQSIRIRSAAMGSDDPEMLSTMRDLAWSLYEQGRLSEAETIQRKALNTQRRVLGADNLETLDSTGNLAEILDEEGNYVQAERLDREVMEKKKRVLGPEAPGTLAAMDNLAVMLSNAGRLDEAEKLEEDTLEIQLRVYGRENLGTINSMLNVAAMKMDLGRTEEAEKNLRELLELEQRVLGPNQPETAITIYNLADLAAQRGHADEALSLLGQALDHGLHARGALKIEKDPYFNSLHGDPRFAALVAHAKALAAAHKGN